MSKPSSWRSTLVLVIVAMIVAQGLLATVAPLVPWLVATLALVLVTAGIVAFVIRRSTRW